MGDQHLAFGSINFNPGCNWAIPVIDLNKNLSQL